MRPLNRWHAAVLVVAASFLVAGCETLPSRSKIGAVALEPDAMTVLWGNCPGERVKRVELRLTDKKHSKTERVVWAIEADPAGSDATSFTVGHTPAGYREGVPCAGAPHRRGRQPCGPTEPARALVLGPGQSATFRFRIMSRDAHLDARQLQEEQARFAGLK